MFLQGVPNDSLFSLAMNFSNNIFSDTKNYFIRLFYALSNSIIFEKFLREIRNTKYKAYK